MFFQGPPARADALLGNLNFPVSGNQGSRLWDISGSYDFLLSDQNVVLNATLAMARDGQFTGAGTLSGNTLFGNFSLDTNFSSVITTTPVSTAFLIKVKGVDDQVAIDLSRVNGHPGIFTGSVAEALTLACQIDEKNLQTNEVITGSVTIKIPKQAGLAASISKTFVLPRVTTFAANLPLGMNGTWTLRFFNLGLDANNKYTGTSRIGLSNGTTYNFAVTGAYAPTTGVSAINLTGIGDTLGVHLAGRFTYDANSGELTAVKIFTGKIAGQVFTLKSSNSTPPLTLPVPESVTYSSYGSFESLLVIDPAMFANRVSRVTQVPGSSVPADFAGSAGTSAGRGGRGGSGGLSPVGSSGASGQ